MRRTWPAALLFLGACGALPGTGSRTGEAERLVVAAFAEANPPGRVGVEVGGKGVWFSAPMFDNGCLQNKDLAHRDLARTRPASARDVPRMSPTFAAQDHFVYPTARGWCVFVGSDPELRVRNTSYLDGKYRVEVDVGPKSPSPWWECATSEAKHRFVEVVEQADGQLALASPVDLHLGDCPRPLPPGEGRTARSRPTQPAPRPPTRDDVAALARAFDDALFSLDFPRALDLVSCYNLYVEKPYGACAAAELVAVGPLPREGTGPQHGVPWLESSTDTLDALGRILPDARDRSLFHVEVKHPRTGHRRTFAVQWVEDAWKLVGVVGRKGEGLTSARFVYDLDRKEKREVFERRMKGEPIEEDGRPMDPYADPEG